MEKNEKITVQNWVGDILSFPRVVTEARSVEDIVAVMKDSERYPSPVRAIGSNHSTTQCGIADNGTVLKMKSMNRILNIGKDTVTVEAGALYIDVAKELQKHKLQFHVNVELGNLTMGSAACGGTKDASMPGEFGQVCSYCIGMKLVTPSGELLEVTEKEPELLQVMRSSYGLLGIIYEVTFKVRPLTPMSVENITYDIKDFVDRFPSLKARGESMMFYFDPFQDKVTVEYRRYTEGRISLNRLPWRIRNWSWKTAAPLYGFYLTTYIPFQPLRNVLLDSFNTLIHIVLSKVVKGTHTNPSDQIIRYPDVGNNSKYTFSIWGFPEDKYSSILLAYFDFCKDYYKKYGYRCNMLNVGYYINKDTSSLFSYSYNDTVMSLDPVSTGNPGWESFIDAYNNFCSEHGDTPLFNQSRGIRRYQVALAFGERIAKFMEHQKRYDPEDRLLNEYFKRMFK